MEVSEAADACTAVLETIESAVIARRSFLEAVLVGVLSRGHVLIEDVPGTGKTLSARSFASALGLSFSRIQFTPDLLPTDITGTHVFDERDRSFEFNEGPIFANVVLADEINRAPPKTQAALLEAMEERQVTTEGVTRELPSPFVVLATENPVEHEGSLHPNETVYMDGRLWRAGDALDYAVSQGELVHDGSRTRLYDADTTTQTLEIDGNMAERECLVYESDYEGRIYTVRTQSGREIRVSGNHPFLVNRGGTVQWVQARNLDMEDTIVSTERLRLASKPLPTHDETLDILASEFDVVRRERVSELRERLRAGGPLSHAELNDLRIASGYSKTELADEVSASYDQVLNYFQGIENGVGKEIRSVLRGEDIPTVDFVESYSISRFDEELNDEEAGFLIGFVLSDGHFTDGSIKIYQKNYPEVFDRWVRLAEKLGFSPQIRDIRGGREASIYSKPLVDYLDERYSLRTPSKTLSAPEEFRRAFLDIFLLAESHFDATRRRVTFTQQDAETTNLIAHLLLGCGIRPWITDEDRVYRLKIQGEDLRQYLELFTWPGDPPDVDRFESTHRVTPVDWDKLERIVELLGIKYAGNMSEREWYNSYNSVRVRGTRMRDDKLDAFVRDAQGTLSRRNAVESNEIARRSLAAAARGCGLSITDVIEETGLSKRSVWEAYEGGPPPQQAVEYVTERRGNRLKEAEQLIATLGDLINGDVFYDPVTEIDSEPYEGTVIGLSVPRTHNYVAGFGGCGINHNTFPLPEAQVDRFVVQTAIGYPDFDGEVELLRRRAGRDTRSPTVDRVLSREEVLDLRRTPETIEVDEDLLSYMVGITRATRGDHRVEFGVSPRGTQRLFEASRARATIEGRTFVTPDDIKTVAGPVLAHRLVLTPEATVDDVDKQAVVDDVLESVSVPTVDSVS